MNPEIPLPAFSVASKNNKPNFKTKYVYTGDKQKLNGHGRKARTTLATR